MVQFISDLQHTPAGIRYRKAWDAAQRALKSIMRMQSMEDVNVDLLNAVRRDYIARMDKASLALGVLSETYAWPREAHFVSTFTYQPPARGAPRRRTEP